MEDSITTFEWYSENLRPNSLGRVRKVVYPNVTKLSLQKNINHELNYTTKEPIYLAGFNAWQTIHFDKFDAIAKNIISYDGEEDVFYVKTSGVYHFYLQINTKNVSDRTYGLQIWENDEDKDDKKFVTEVKNASTLTYIKKINSFGKFRFWTSGIEESSTMNIELKILHIC